MRCDKWAFILRPHNLTLRLLLFVFPLQQRNLILCQCVLWLLQCFLLWVKFGYNFSEKKLKFDKL